MFCTRMAMSSALVLMTSAVLHAGNQKVLVIGVDGLIPAGLDAAMSQGMAPNIQALVANGSYSNQAQTAQKTFSGPGWSDIYLGVHFDEHRVGTNSVDQGHNPPIFSGSQQHLFPDFNARVNTYDPSLVTAWFTTWSPLHDTRTPGGSDYAFFHNYGSDGDNVVTLDAVNFITNNDPDVIHVYQADPDVTGHGAGYSATNPTYLAEVQETDGNIGQLMTAIQNRPNYANEDWLYILTSDHGGTGTGHGSNIPLHRTIPFLVSGDNVVKQSPGNNPMFIAPQNVDVAPTVLNHLGIPTSDPAWDGLRGHVVGAALSVQPTIAEGQNLVLNGDAEYDHGFAEHSLDQAVGGWNDPAGNNGFTVIQYGSGSGFPGPGDPIPADHGDNFFSSGSSGSGSMSQLIDLGGFSSPTYSMSAYLGGFAGQDDNAQFNARFLAGDGTELGTAVVGPVTAGDRGDVTSLLFRQTSGTLPLGTQQIEFILGSTGNDGYADNLFFALGVTDIFGDLDNDGDVDGQDWLTYIAGLGLDLSGMNPVERLEHGDMNGDGFNNHADFLIFKDVYNQHNGQGAFDAMLVTIPEPATLTLLCTAAGLFMRPRGRR